MKDMQEGQKLNKNSIDVKPENMGLKWTEEQSEAIYARDCNLLVAAAAGSGKTAVLVERIIRKITEPANPVDIDRMLIVTFTNAAAAEMRERIGEAIAKEIDSNPESENMRRQLSLLARANIMTIHSFCKNVISKHIQVVGIDPNFRVADATESTLMKIEAMNEIIAEQYEQDSQDFLNILSWYADNKSDQKIQDMVMNLYNFVQSDPWPEQWLEEKTQALNVDEQCDFSQTLWGKILIKSCQMELSNAVQALTTAIDIIDKAEGLEKYLAVFEEDLNNIEDVLNTVVTLVDDKHNEQNIWDEIYEKVNRVQFSRLPRAGKDVDKEKQEIVRRIRDKVKKTITKTVGQRLVNAQSSNIIKDLNELYPVMSYLAKLVNVFSEKYKEKKDKKSVIDFNDLEHLCLKIVTQKTQEGILPSSVAMEYRKFFEEVMVDEYQDSNMVQEIIIQMVSRYDLENPNVFMVGDVKQSIYRFRQAKPELFLNKYNIYGIGEGNKNRKVLLYKNFRSRREIIEAVNLVFGSIMSVDAGELDYTEKEALNYGANFQPRTDENTKVGGEIEFHLIQTTSDSNDYNDLSTLEESPGSNQDENTEIIDNIQSEARLVADKIIQLTNEDESGKHFNIFDKNEKCYRKVLFKDIVILLRATKNWSDVFVDELAAKGIPAFADTGTGFFKTIEIQVILSLLQIIDNPLQDIPLLSVLRSPIFAFTTGELAAVRIANREPQLFNAISILSDSHPNTEGTDVDIAAARKASVFIEKLSLWREKSRYLSTDQLIWYLYQDTNYYNMVGAMPQGQQRQANLRSLYDKARQFEETSYKGLFNFINFVDKIKSNRGDMGSAKILGENDNVVRIMSIHKSKGLEFPVVFLSGCGKRFNLTDVNNSVLMHPEIGFGPDVVDVKLRTSHSSAAKIAIAERIKMETLSEEIRILYVAMTRAREKLIITGTVRDIEKTIVKWKDISNGKGNSITASEVLRCSSFVDWIGATLSKVEPNIQSDSKKIYINTYTGSDYDDVDAGKTHKWKVQFWNKDDMLYNDYTQHDLAVFDNADQAQSAEIIGFVPPQEQYNDTVDIYGLSGTGSNATIHFDKNEKTKGCGGYWNEVSRRLDWTYPYIKLENIPAKVTVTELKRRFEAEREHAGQIPVQVPTLISKPLFLEGKKGLSAAEKGTVLHFVMQHLDIHSGLDNTNIKEQIESMIKKDLLTKEQVQTISVEKINGFFKSSLGKRMLASETVQREVPFNIEIPSHELFIEMIEEKYRSETILLQGIIDCYFEEPDGLVLIDYKTDYVPFGQSDIIVERYRVQIDYYARTLTLLTGKPIKEKYIYLFSTGEIINI